MKAAVLGCGGIGLATAAWLAHHGHQPVLWSPSGNGTRDLVANGGSLRYTGIIEGTATIAVASDIAEAVTGAQVVFIAVPGNGHRMVMEALAPHLDQGQAVIVNSSCSLSPLYLSKLLSERGVALPIITWGTTVLTARRRSGTEVAIMTARQSLHVATLPVSANDEGIALCEELFGKRFLKQSNILATSLININPIAHLGLALCNVTRIERREVWPQYHYMTEGVSNLIMALEGERLALANAFGLSIHGIEEHFHRSFDVPKTALAEIAETLHARRGGPPGPVTMDTRFVLEDTPFGLVFAETLAPKVNLPVPLHTSAIHLVSAIWQRDFRSDNNLLPVLGLDRLSMDQLVDVIHNGWKG